MTEQNHLILTKFEDGININTEMMNSERLSKYHSENEYDSKQASKQHRERNNNKHHSERECQKKRAEDRTLEG